MLRLAADEDFNHRVISGVRQRQPTLDIVRVQEAGLSGTLDPGILEWAAKEGRVLLTHDVTTVTKHAYERVQTGQSMPGVFEVSRAVPIGLAVEDILLLVECSLDNEWEGQVRYLPL